MDFLIRNVRNEIIKSGAIDFIQKPYNSEQIVTMIRNMLNELKKVVNFKEMPDLNG